MPRRRCRRRISYMPEVCRFAPIGGPVMPEEVNLTLGEFEAIRLKDLQGMEQEKAAEQMNISQPTFHRMILGARKKVADALVNNKTIRIGGGEYEMANGNAGRGLGRGFGSGVGRGRGQGIRPGVGPGGYCICPKCGYKEKKIIGKPCTETKCKKCGTIMIRE